MDRFYLLGMKVLYILIKNFEVLKISREDALTLIIKPILNEISNEKQIKNETLVNMFRFSIYTIITRVNSEFPFSFPRFMDLFLFLFLCHCL